MTSAMVLCAGLGTRLRPLTDELPKPLMPVGDRPAVAHTVEALGRAGIGRIVVNAHHRAAELEAWARTSAGAIEVVHEPEVLGTAGGVHNAREPLGAGAVLVWNGDILAPSFDVQALVARWSRSGLGAIWGIAPRPKGEGTVGLDDEGCVVRLRGRRFGEERSGGDFLGVQVMGEEIRRVLPPRGCFVADVALPWLERGGRLGTFAFEGEWDDIGDAAALLRANLRWLERRGLPFFAAPDAEVAEGVTLRRSVVGAKAVVTGAGLVERCVVFPAARADAPRRQTIVARRSRVEIAADV